MRSFISRRNVLLLAMLLLAAVAEAQTGTGADTGIGTVTANQGSTPWTVKPDGTSWTLTGTSANINVTNTVAASQSGSWTVQQGTPPWTIKPDGTAWTLTGTSANVNLTNSPTVNQGSANATPWNQNVAQVGGISVAATSKGTQASNFLPVQRPTDGGRTPLVLFVDAIAAITTEALETLTINLGGTVTSGTSYTVTTGKTLRLIGGGVQVANTSTTACNVRARLRAAATVSVTSPIYLPAGAVAPSNVTAAGASDSLALPDGLEFAAGTQIGISHLSNSTSCLVSFMVMGFEY